MSPLVARDRLHCAGHLLPAGYWICADPRAVINCWRCGVAAAINANGQLIPVGRSSVTVDRIDQFFSSRRSSSLAIRSSVCAA